MLTVNMKLFMCIIFLGTIRGDPTLVHENITIAYGSDFQTYLITQSDEKIIECFLHYSVEDNDNTVKVVNLTLDLHEEKYYNVDIYKNRLSSLGHNICGFKIKNVQRNDPSEFMINVVYSNYEKHSNNWNSTFKINYKDNEKILKVDLGDKSEINCKNSGDQLECLIINPQGEDVLIWKKPCIYTIHHVMHKDVGRWTCISSVINKMEPLQEYVQLELRGADETKKSMVKTWYKEENGYGMIGCQYINEAGVGELPNYCQFEMPDKNMLILKETLATVRYTTLGLNLTAYKCQLEFPLPMLDAEKGIWTCYVGVTGGMINTGSESDIPPIEEQEIWLQPNDDSSITEKIEIFCNAPYMTDNCYIESPTGIMYTNNIFNSWLGLCRTPSISLNLTLHVGEWKCHFSRPDNAQDDIIKVHVINYQRPIQKLPLQQEILGNVKHVRIDDDL